MANETVQTRTNYFSVTDEGKFQAIITACIGSGEIRAMRKMMDDGVVKHAFCCEGSIRGLPYRLIDGDMAASYEKPGSYADLDADICWDFFTDAIQEILPEGDAIIIFEAGNEATRYFMCYSAIITKHEIQFISLQKEAVLTARRMLLDPSFDTCMGY